MYGLLQLQLDHTKFQGQRKRIVEKVKAFKIKNNSVV